MGYLFVAGFINLILYVVFKISAKRRKQAKTMNRRLLLLVVSTFSLAGCSTPTTESQPKYDEVDLMVYEMCMENIVEGLTNSKSGFYLMTPTYIAGAKDECAELKPEKK